MATYIKPQVLVFQEFNALPPDLTVRLRAHISGGHAQLHRYGIEYDGKLGEYNSLAVVDYDWPNKKAGSVVDLDYVKLYIDDAKLEYFADLIGEGSEIKAVSGSKNRIRSNTLSFKQNGAAYPRSPQFLDRDVRPGDLVRVKLPPAEELWTYVKDVRGDIVPSVVGSSTADPNNRPNQNLQTEHEQIAGVDNAVNVTAVNGTNYDGLKTGDIDETYFIEVISGSTGGNLHTGLLRVTSSSGRDNVPSVVPSAAGVPTPIGTRGLTVTFDHDDNPNDNFVPGQKWRVRVRQAYTAPAHASSGTYTGSQDTTYIVQVVKGGKYTASEKPEIVVTTTTGIDVSGPTKVNASGSAVPVGTLGVQITFTGGTGLCKGDKFYIPVQAAKEGHMRILVLGHDLPAAMLSGQDLELRLFIKKNIQVPSNRIGFAPLKNWEAFPTHLRVHPGIIAYDDSWTSGGVKQPLPVTGGSLCVEYREWLRDFVGVVEQISDPGQIGDVLGTLHPDNPLAWGVFKALANSNGAAVAFTAVSDPKSLSAWEEVVEALVGDDNVYNLVPLTYNRQVQDLFAAHVKAQSGPESGKWRAAIFNLKGRAKVPVVDQGSSSNGQVVLATLSDDPNRSGVQYTLLTITSGNAELIKKGVRPGDVVRYLYTTDGFGSELFSEFVVDSVLSESSLLLVSGHDSPITVPQKVEIWRNLSKSEIAEDVGKRAASFGSRRVCVVWPDEVGSGGLVQDGYYLAAALAGLRSGVLPHQGLTNVEVVGFDDLSRSSVFFNSAHLDTMAGLGVWIVVQDQDGPVYSRHALTTDNTDLNRREEQVRTNVDAMSYAFLRVLRPYIGRTNISPRLINHLNAVLGSVINNFKSNALTADLGPQLVDGRIREMRQHAVLKDRLVIVVDLVLPYPVNNIELYLVV